MISEKKDLRSEKDPEALTLEDLNKIQGLYDEATKPRKVQNLAVQRQAEQNAVSTIPTLLNEIRRISVNVAKREEELCAYLDKAMEELNDGGQFCDLHEDVPENVRILATDLATFKVRCRELQEMHIQVLKSLFLALKEDI